MRLAPWLEPLIALAAETGSTVAFESIASGADGYYRPKTKAIVVEVAHSSNRCVKTLVHELVADRGTEATALGSVTSSGTSINASAGATARSAWPPMLRSDVITRRPTCAASTPWPTAAATPPTPFAPAPPAAARSWPRAAAGQHGSGCRRACKSQVQILPPLLLPYVLA